MQTDKTALREKSKLIRYGMSQNEVMAKSHIINKKLLDEILWGEIKTILAYRPIADLNEVSLALENRQGAEIRFIGKSKNQNLPDRTYDLIIVPTLAFDKDNYRLGWGGGFYDRLLATQPQALKIGLCFANGFVKEGLPHEPHDIRLDKIITEQGII